MAGPVSFKQFFNIVGNEKRAAINQAYQGVDPSTGEYLWEVPVATQKDLDDAVVAGNAAFTEWSTLEHSERSRLMNEFAARLEKHKAELSYLLNKETGKPIEFAESEIALGISTVRLNSQWSVSDEIFKDDANVKIVIQYAPVGLVGGIVPWNFPFQLAILKVAPPLMAGCTTIIKPSPFTPYTALKLVEIASQIFPPGVVQVLGGGDSLGPWMTRHPGIAKISFTGSIATGKKVMAAAAETLKRVNLELGGNDAAVVTDDFNMAKAAQLTVMASFPHSGQICMATKRIYVHESCYDEFMGHFTTIVRGLRPGEGYCSPIQNKLQYTKVKGLYADCENNKYKFAVGNSHVPELQPGSGFFVSPAVIARPPDDSRIVQEEPFGPIIPVLTFRDDSEVIDRVNDTKMGLGATVYCRDEKRTWHIAGSLETGSVWVNGGLKLHPMALFGAHKQSGIGGELGPLALKNYTNTRTITYWKVTDPTADGKLFA
ncbi:aldehyde dehydrogenase [Thozetella sp. PMI_491]|nr:aldehyde dehydrogenase [Thozetella sp. PMI_491]